MARRHGVAPAACVGLLRPVLWRCHALAVMLPAVAAMLATAPALAAPVPQLTAPVQRCLERAAQQAQVPLPLLEAIALVESGGNPAAVNRHNRNGSYDVGLMQINSRWLPRLAAWNIHEQDLYDPCVSAAVGAWILADNIRRLGPVWRAVGAYNARTPALQWRYVQRVQAMLARRASGVSGGAPATAAAAVSGALPARGRLP